MQELSCHHSSKSINPLKLAKEYQWAVTRQSIRVEGLLVLHNLNLPGEINMPSGFTSHWLAVQLGHEKRQITRIDGQEYDGSMVQGESLLFPAQMSISHTWKTANPCLIFVIDHSLLVRVAQETNCLNSNNIELQPILKNYDPQIEAFASLFLQEMLSKQAGNQLYYESLTNLFVIHLLRKYCLAKPKLREYRDGLSPQKLQRAIDFIHGNLNRKLTLKEIAAQLDMSIFYFCDLFKQSMGIPPYTYVLKQRVKLAQKLLQNPNKNISAIALECGFANQTHLNKHFRKLIGQTPKQYRRQLM